MTPKTLAALCVAVVAIGPPASAQATLPPEPEVYEVADVQPELIGGLGALQSAVVYPEFARRAGVEGTVVVQFVVDERGNVVDPVVVRSPNDLLSEAALTAVRKARFTPGQQRGRPVKVRFAVPVTFRLTARAPDPRPARPALAQPAVHPSPLLSTTHEGSDFREVRWGDLRRAVRQTEPGRPTVPYPGTIEYRARVFDRPAKVLYSFAGDALLRAGYQFDTETRVGTESLFDDLRELLVSKYGEPTRCGSDNGGTSYVDRDDSRSCEWDGSRTVIRLGTSHDPDVLSEWHFLLVTYAAQDDAPIVEAGARIEAPALFGPRVMTDGATALYGLDWGASEAAVRQRLGRALDTSDEGTGRLVLFRAPEVAGYGGTVLATFYDGGLHSLFATYESDYLDAGDSAFFRALASAALGDPEGGGTTDDGVRVVRWRNDRAAFAFGYEPSDYDESSVYVSAVSAESEDAEARDRQRHADDF